MIHRLLGIAQVPVQRYADDPDVVEASLILGMQRFGDRQRPRVPATQTIRNQAEIAYLEDLRRIDRRLASRATQNKD